MSMTSGQRLVALLFATALLVPGVLAAGCSTAANTVNRHANLTPVEG